MLLLHESLLSSVDQFISVSCFFSAFMFLGLESLQVIAIGSFLGQLERG